MIVSLLYNGALLLYALCFLPKMLWQWCVRGKYHESFLARLGFALPQIEIPPGKKLLWIHAVSMGETRAVIPLYQLLRQSYPDLLIAISSTTETGHREAKRYMPEASAHFYLPFDFSWIMKKYIDHLRPSYLLLVESDLWYHLLLYAKKHEARLFLINGKISERSTRRFRCVPFFTQRLFSLFDLLCVQDAAYRERFLSCGAPSEKLHVTGNIKLDAQSPLFTPGQKQHFMQELGISPMDRIFVIISTHEPEEEWLLTALKPLWEQIAYFKVLLIPRHPDRFSQVAALLQRKQIPSLIYSQRDRASPTEKREASVILIDGMGLVYSCLQVAECALVAGSFVTHVGGHNIFEPILYGVPVLFGPHMQAQRELQQIILEAGAGRQITLPELPGQLLAWYQHPEQRRPYVEVCQSLRQQVQGATQRTFAAIRPFLFSKKFEL